MTPDDLAQQLREVTDTPAVHRLVHQHGREQVVRAWKLLGQVDKSALHVAKAFDGTIIR